MLRHRVRAKVSDLVFPSFFAFYALAAAAWLLLGLAPALISLSLSAHDSLHRWVGAEQEVEVSVKSWGGEFHQDELVLPASGTVVLNFSNDEKNVRHNVALYEDASTTTPIFRSKDITGPGRARYTFRTPPVGTYYFRDDLHPSMHGPVTVVAAGEATLPTGLAQIVRNAA
ncbi:MAG: cupredoxin domain-containing protein, partial [Chloroflexota bacterium]|nr:cupredoxin domain-containing protein [Chloroflexota bacterium]